MNSLLWIILILVALPFVAALFMEKTYSLSASITINRSQSDVFNYIRFIDNQKHYNKWVMADPQVKTKTTGTDGTVGFISAWESQVKNVGVGAQEITKIIDGQGYEAELRFEKPFKGVSHAVNMTAAVSPTQTTVTFTFHSSNPYPMNLMVPMIKKMLTKDMNENCANLKKVLEA
jgi:hypothetical protein